MIHPLGMRPLEIGFLPSDPLTHWSAVLMHCVMLGMLFSPADAFLLWFVIADTMLLALLLGPRYLWLESLARLTAVLGAVGIATANVLHRPGPFAYVLVTVLWRGFPVMNTSMRMFVASLAVWTVCKLAPGVEGGMLAHFVLAVTCCLGCYTAVVKCLVPPDSPDTSAE